MLVENDDFSTSGPVLAPQEPILVKIASFWPVRAGESLVDVGGQPYSWGSDETVYAVQCHVNQQAQANQPGFRSFILTSRDQADGFARRHLMA